MFKYINNISFCRIPSGKFRFGMDWNMLDFVKKSENYRIPIEWLLKETPLNEIYLDEYDISDTPITVGMMSEFFKYNPKIAIPKELKYNIDNHNMDLPAYPISYELALSFCAWLSFMLNEWIDLPTECEWEKSSRGTGDRTFPWGDSENYEILNIRKNGVPSKPINIKTHLENVSIYGVYDLAGNVEEWTKSYNKPYKNSKLIYSNLLSYPILRGGTSEHGIDLARSTRRHGNHPSLYTGFRIVKRKNAANITSIMYQNVQKSNNLKIGDFVLGKILNIDSDSIVIHLLNDIKTLVNIESLPTEIVELFGSFKNKDSEILLKIEDIIDDIYLCKRPSLEEIDQFFTVNQSSKTENNNLELNRYHGWGI